MREAYCGLSTGHNRNERIQQQEVSTLKDLGFADRGDHSIGLTHAPVTVYSTIDPQDKQRAFFVSVNYPFAGLSLDQFMGAVSPFGANMLLRDVTREDWRLPSDAFYVTRPDHPTRRRHVDHMRIPEYPEFAENHYQRWIDALDRTDEDGFFQQFSATRFIDIDKFLLNQRAIQNGWPKEEALPLYLNPDEELRRLFVKLFLNSPGNPLMLMDPFSGKGVGYQLSESSLPIISTFPPIERNRNVVLSREGIAAEIALGTVDEEGFYQEDDVHMTFPEGYRSDALFPLIAWEETEEGRTFLSQGEATRLLPDSIQQRGDVFLGRVVLAYFQPDVTAQFPKRMHIPNTKSQGKVKDNGGKDKEKDGQKMRAAQAPVWVSQPQHAKALLQTELVTGVQEQILASAG